MFLTEKEIRRLTGRAYPKHQREWLEAHGYKHDLDANDRPVVLWAEVERVLMGGSKSRRRRPDFTALDEAG